MRHYEIIVVDNGSTEPATLAYLAEIARLDNVRVLSWDKPFNYSAINNFAVSQAKGDDRRAGQQRHRGHLARLADRDGVMGRAGRCRLRGRQALLRQRHDPARRRDTWASAAWLVTRTSTIRPRSPRVFFPPATVAKPVGGYRRLSGGAQGNVYQAVGGLNETDSDGRVQRRRSLPEGPEHRVT